MTAVFRVTFCPIGKPVIRFVIDKMPTKANLYQALEALGMPNGCRDLLDNWDGDCRDTFSPQEYADDLGHIFIKPCPFVEVDA